MLRSCSPFPARLLCVLFSGSVALKKSAGAGTIVVCPKVDYELKSNWKPRLFSAQKPSALPASVWHNLRRHWQWDDGGVFGRTPTSPPPGCDYLASLPFRLWQQLFAHCCIIQYPKKSVLLTRWMVAATLFAYFTAHCTLIAAMFLGRICIDGVHFFRVCRRIFQVFTFQGVSRAHPFLCLFFVLFTIRTLIALFV